MIAKQRPYQYYDSTISICGTCHRRVDAKVVFQDGCVWMLKRCPEHGPDRILLADDIAYYKLARENFTKTPEQVLTPNTPVRYGCPYDCGICPDHEQHGCTLLIEVTDNCNLRCPTCYANSGPERLQHRSLEHIGRMLDRAVANEGEPSIVQISGGEPTIHPQIVEILEMARARPIGHLMVNTNGVRIANEPGFAERLKEAAPGLEIYLQFDSLHADALKTLRGTDLRNVHARAVEKLNELDIHTTLVATVRRGVNDHELGEIIEYAIRQSCVRGVTFQPVQAAGRLEQYDAGYNKERDRLTLTEVRRRILEQYPVFAPEDLIPVPCNSDHLAMAYALKLKSEIMPLTGLVDPDFLIDAGRATITYETEPEIRDYFLQLFSTHHSTESQTDAMQQFLDRLAATPNESLGYENVFRVLIVEFADAHSFDLRSIRKSCVHIVHPDAERVIPFDTYNMFYRDELERERLEPLRSQSYLPMTGPISLARYQNRQGLRS
ncbi:MAG: radical SAM protein [Woeseiaceae bacterium]|nr:radical SAM protein [Woeseiaceae bacterium]